MCSDNARDPEAAPAPGFTELSFAPLVPIPAFLTGEIQSKLAYVDEQILAAQVKEDQITLKVASAAGLAAERQAELRELLRESHRSHSRKSSTPTPVAWSFIPSRSLKKAEGFVAQNDVIVLLPRGCCFSDQSRGVSASLK